MVLFMTVVGLIVTVVTTIDQLLKNKKETKTTIATSTILIWILGNCIDVTYYSTDPRLAEWNYIPIIMIIGSSIYLCKNAYLFRNTKSIVQALLHGVIGCIFIYALSNLVPEREYIVNIVFFWGLCLIIAAVLNIRGTLKKTVDSPIISFVLYVLLSLVRTVYAFSLGDMFIVFIGSIFVVLYGYQVVIIYRSKR